MMAVIPKKATTVILLRGKESKDLKYFSSSDMKKAVSWVEIMSIQGGRVDRNDGSLEICSFCQGITPEARSERFDTRFFLASHPVGQEASYDQKETTAGVWITPKEALEENLRGEVALSPPTLKTLEDLSRFENIDDVFNSLKKNEVNPILPILTKISSVPLLLFPWDPEYDVFQRGEIPSLIDHGRPSQPDDNTTRLLLKEGCWLPYCRTY